MAMRQMKLRLSDEDYERLGQLAAEAGVPMAAYVRNAIRASDDVPADLRSLLTRARANIDQALRAVQ